MGFQNAKNRINISFCIFGKNKIMYVFTFLPALVILGFLAFTLYKHFVKKNKQDLKASFLVVLGFSVIWCGLYYLVFS
ncbi:hypothetical protein IO90_03900 [Chryseobacterium sp. FH1]|nr:hypothetical protein IO90_03900 [Chryseobacterium sp. FH1]